MLFSEQKSNQEQHFSIFGNNKKTVTWLLSAKEKTKEKRSTSLRMVHAIRIPVQGKC